jgi:hypothetical protein
MAANILAFIQFDDNSPVDAPPFTNDASWWNLKDDYGLWGCKDYDFIAAISGLRNKKGLPPLIPLRGCPAKPPHALKEYDDEPIGFLTRSEILRCLAHCNLPVERLNTSIQIVLAVLQILANKYGDDRVRLVFAIIE